MVDSVRKQFVLKKVWPKERKPRSTNMLYNRENCQWLQEASFNGNFVWISFQKKLSRRKWYIYKDYPRNL